MLDQAIIDQLKGHFAGIDVKIEFVVRPSDHAQQGELVELLESVASAGEALSVRFDRAPFQLPEFNVVAPAFTIFKAGKPTGVNFIGIPGGHEFSSLVLAVLNVAGKGRLPDHGLVRRIRALKGTTAIRTYISLTCENCPDVVQSLNQIALIHGNLPHFMVDGQFAQSDLAELNIQGVPSVVIGRDLIHSGRATFAELLAKLEETLGIEASATGSREISDLGHFEVAVIGGGPAGASSAIYSVRKGQRTALIADRIGGQLQETKGIENLISVLYTEGQQLSANIHEHLRSYPVTILEHRRVASVTPGTDGRKKIALDSGEILTCDSLIVATGAKWRELGIPGEKEYLGRGVAFCPHCDGPYYKGKRVSVIGGGNSGVEAAIDLAGICSEVTLFEFADKLKADDVLVKKLQSLSNVKVYTNAKTASIVGNGEKVVGMTWEDRAAGAAVGPQKIDLDGVFVQIGLSPNSAIVKDLVETTKFGEIVVDTKGRTNVPGVYAAGDVTTTPYKQIIIAMGEGAKVALTAFEDRMRAG